MKRRDRSDAGLACDARQSGGAAQTLIHTNNSPKRASMRVSVSLESATGVSFWAIWQAQELLRGPIGFLMASRAAPAAPAPGQGYADVCTLGGLDGAKSTR